MEIRLAKASDLDAVAAIYDAVLQQEERGICYTNWQKGLYPRRETAERGWRDGTLFVLEEAGQICASMVLNQVQPKEYGTIEWVYPAAPQEVFVIHTLCVHPAQTKKGYAKAMVVFAEEQARKQKGRVMRLDTYVGNQPAVALYRHLGYRLAGSTDFLFEGVIPEELYCVEKRL